jgi:hypothetical protein
MKDKRRMIIVSDVHGCIEEFREILDLVNYKSPNVRIILLGDLLDRGPESAKCVKLARELDLECVKGNHEVKFLKWYKGNKHFDYPKYYDKFSDDDINYINRMPLYVKLAEDFWILHAGVKPGIPLEKQKANDLTYLRYNDPDGKFVSVKKVARGEAPEAVFWTAYGSFGATIVYGHEVHSLTDIRVDKFDDQTACWGVDTGACFGGRLSAISFQDGKYVDLVQVQAKKEYAKYFGRQT